MMIEFVAQHTFKHYKKSFTPTASANSKEGGIDYFELADLQVE
jgi:hypothetical protein